jgi:hypothetical protein
MGGGSREKCSKPAFVRLLIRLSRITCTSYPGSGNGIICTVPPNHQPTAGRRRAASWSGDVGEISCAEGCVGQGAELCGAQASGRGAMPPHVISFLSPLPMPTREGGREPRAAVGFSHNATGLPKYDALNRSCRMVWFEEELHRPLSRTVYGARNQIGRRPY